MFAKLIQEIEKLYKRTHVAKTQGLKEGVR